MEQRMVIIKNLVNHRVGISIPELGLQKKWTKKGAMATIPFDMLEQALWYAGVRTLFEKGSLYIESMQDKIDLGLEPVGATEPENIIVLNDGQRLNILKLMKYEEFVDKVSQLNRTQVDNLIEYAIENKIVDVDKCTYLKKLTGKDIIKTIALKEEMQDE